MSRFEKLSHVILHCQYHIIVQLLPTYSVTKLVMMIKSFSAREMVSKCPHVKKQLWGGEFLADGYFVSTIGKYGG